MQGEEGTAGSVVQPGQVPPAGARPLSGREPAVSSSSVGDTLKVQGLLLPKTAIMLSSGWPCGCRRCWLHMCECTQIHTHTLTHTSTHAHIHMHPQTHAHTHACTMHTRTHTWMHTYTYMHTQAHMHANTRIHTHTHPCMHNAHTYTHAHTHMHTRTHVHTHTHFWTVSPPRAEAVLFLFVHQFLPLPRRPVNVCGVESGHRAGVSPGDSRDPRLVCPFLHLGQMLS